MSRSKAKDEFSFKVCWVFYEQDYSELRKADGCSKLSDLETTVNDKENAIVAAKKMGIPDEEIHIFQGLNAQELNKMIRRECYRYTGFAYEGKKVFIFVYAAGHGVEEN